MESFNLIAANCHFQKPKRKQWTFAYPNSTRAQLDYILIRRKWVNSVRNCEPFSSTFSSVYSVHRPLSLSIKLSLRTMKIEKDSARSINLKSLTSYEELRSQYTVSVSNRFQAIEQEDKSESTLQSKYDHLTQSCCEVGKELLPKKPKSK